MATTAVSPTSPDFQGGAHSMATTAVSPTSPDFQGGAHHNKCISNTSYGSGVRDGDGDAEHDVLESGVAA
jgi:hypothetical protein